MRSLKRFGAAASFATCLAVTACTGMAARPSGVPLEPIVSAVDVRTPVADRGSVVDATPITDLSDTLRRSSTSAYRAVYRSTSGITGKPTEVSGAFFLPVGPAPSAGWPVVAFAHGTTGLANGCGVSRSPDLRGYDSLVAGLLDHGYAVAATDYEGLGAQGSHAYLDSQTEGFNVMDSVRALRHLSADVSSRWAGYGESQGGQAVWAANELAAGYGVGLDLVGTVALSPATNVTALTKLAQDGDLSASQQVILPLVVMGASRIDTTLRPSTVIPGVTDSEWGDLLGCDNETRVRTAKQLQVGDTVTLDGPTAARLDQILQKQALPQHRLDAPMLVLNGDADDLVRPEWVQHSVAQSCALGGPGIEHHVIAGAGHGNLGQESRSLNWLNARFALQAMESTC